MGRKKYEVRLSTEERDELTAMLRCGETKATELRRAQILLKADAGSPAWVDTRIAEAFGCSRQTVENIRRRFVERGLSGAVRRKQQEEPSRERILDGKAEARLLTLACSKAPDGRARWSLRLLADRVVELRIAESISYETVRRTLKKAN
jgi:transposase